MGCNSSKAVTNSNKKSNGNGTTTTTTNSNGNPPVGTSMSKKASLSSRQSSSKGGDDDYYKIRADKPERLYKLLAKAQQSTSHEERMTLYTQVLNHCEQEPMAAKWQNPTTKSTPLHLCCRLLDHHDHNNNSNNSNSSSNNPAYEENGDATEELLHILDTLLAIHKAAVGIPDAAGKIPLHYAIAPTTHFQPQPAPQQQQQQPPPSTALLNPHQHVPQTSQTQSQTPTTRNWRARARFVQLLMQADITMSIAYLKQNNVVFESGDATGGCSPLYRVLQTLEDDRSADAPTASYVSVIQHAFPLMTSIGNASDGDKPLALLYRRFTRQFDISEQFFAGDNSRKEVLQHRQQYKTAAGNTWKLIEILLEPQSDVPWGIIHRAVQMETPPDLLRYIVETNAQDLTRVDPSGNLPLHYAAATQPLNASQENKQTHFPAFYTKYVVDELLYKFPEGASMPDANGNFPLTLAIQSGKQWIGGGIKSLYDAYPQALEQIQLEDHPTLTRALSMVDSVADDDDNDNDNDEHEQPKAAVVNGIIKDEHHDAIMLVQQEGVDITEVTTSMWAHEEDAGVQMLGCVAISKMCTATNTNNQNQNDNHRIALTAVAAVVNSMKAHPNEMIVQEKACLALRGLAPADGQREVSMVASGAVAAIVGAMQAHVGDAGVQHEACSALAALIQQGGADRATVVASVSGVTAILNAIAAHAHAVEVQRAGLQSLIALTEYPEANLPELPKTQTEPLLLAAKERFRDECAELVDIVLFRM